MNAVTGYCDTRAAPPRGWIAQEPTAPPRGIAQEPTGGAPIALAEMVREQVANTTRELILANLKGLAAQLAMLQAIPWLGPKIIEWLNRMVHQAAKRILGEDKAKPLEQVVSKIMTEPEELLNSSQDLLESFWNDPKMSGVRELQKNRKDLLNLQKVLAAIRSVFGKEVLNYPWLNKSIEALGKFLEVPEQKALGALPKFKQMLFKLPKPAKIVGLAVAGVLALKILLKLTTWFVKLLTTGFAAVTGFNFFKKHLGGGSSAAAQNNKPEGGGLLGRIKAFFSSDKAKKAMNMAQEVADGTAAGNPVGAALKVLGKATDNEALGKLANLANAATGGGGGTNPLAALTKLLGTKPS